VPVKLQFSVSVTVFPVHTVTVTVGTSGAYLAAVCRQCASVSCTYSYSVSVSRYSKATASDTKQLWQLLHSTRNWSHVTSNALFESSGLAITASDLNASFGDISTYPYYCRYALDDNLPEFVPFCADFFLAVLGRIRSTSPGPKGIPSWMYRTCAVELGPVVAKLVNFSLTQCRVPLVWKTAHITPVPKTSPVTLAGDLRPISVTSILSRTVEKVVVRHYLTPLLRS